MRDELLSFLDNLKRNPRLATYSEDSTKISVILPILRRLGWDIENNEEVTPEFSVEGRRVDYALCLNQRQVIFIEAKKPTEDLDNKRHEEQLLEYSFRQGVDMAILTNGITWSLYLPKGTSNWRARRFYTIDVKEQDSSDVERKLNDLLSKENVRSGKALQHSEALFKGKVKKKAIEEALPEAWNKIIGESDSLFIQMLSEATERICGYKPESGDVIKFIETNEARFLLLPTEELPEAEEESNKRPFRKSSEVSEPSVDKKLSQDDLIPHIVRVLKKHGGKAMKEQVEREIYETFKNIFEQPWYQAPVAQGVPRWQHNLAWAKERAKRRELIQWPSQSGRGYWALTDKGLKSG